MSDGDVSLAENTKFRSFKRAERRMLMGMMNRLNPKYAVLDMQAYAGQWKRIGERIHPAEYPKYSVANQLFNHVRKGLHEDTIAHKVNCCVSMGKVGIAAELISSKPGEFARNLDRFLRNAESHVEALGVIGMFSEVATKVSVPVLLQVKSHFENRIKDTTSNGATTVQTKVYLPKGNVAKAYAEVDKEIKVIPARLCKSIIDICENAITKQFQVCLFVIVNGNKNHAVIGQQIAGKLQPARHKGEPRRVRSRAATGKVEYLGGLLLADAQLGRELFGCKSKAVVIHKTVGSGIIRRVDIDALHRSGV